MPPLYTLSLHSRPPSGIPPPCLGLPVMILFKTTSSLFNYKNGLRAPSLRQGRSTFPELSCSLKPHLNRDLPPLSSRRVPCPKAEILFTIRSTLPLPPSLTIDSVERRRSYWEECFSVFPNSADHFHPLLRDNSSSAGVESWPPHFFPLDNFYRDFF